jgi:acetyltransferase-like isoleucine patch superfamily enzyme
MNYFKNAIDSPWKAVNELKMLALYPLSWFYLKLFVGIDIGRAFKFYGLPKIFKFRSSKIEIGNKFEDRNWWDSNPLGINHPTIICTWSSMATIKIGDDVGISGGSIVSAERVEIGDGTIIGANSTIIDTDFHPLDSLKRRYDTENVRSKAINIGKNVFIGANCLILKGSNIPNNAIIPAGSIVRSNTTFKV